VKVLVLALLSVGGASANVALGRPAQEASTVAPGNVSWSSGAQIGLDWGTLNCPSLDFCAMGGINTSNIYLSTRPLEAEQRFTRRGAAGIATASLFCSTARLCVAGERNRLFHRAHIMVATRPTARRITFHQAGRVNSDGVSNVRCHDQYCAVGTDTGFSFSATPARPGSWVRRSRPRGTDAQVTNCSAVGVCVLPEGPVIYTIEQPQVRSHQWRAWRGLSPRETSAGDAFGLPGDCAGSACLVPTEAGEIFADPDVSSGTGSWTSTVVTDQALEGALCASVSRCYALGAKLTKGGPVNPTFLYSDDPFDASPLWRSVPIPVSVSTQINDFACPSSSVCLFEATKITRHGKADPTLRSHILVAHIL
jgi:hypothetical protein